MPKIRVKPNFKRTNKGLIFEVKNYYSLVRQLLIDYIEFTQRLSQATRSTPSEMLSDMVVLELYKTHFTEPYPQKARITLRFSEALALSYVLLSSSSKEINFLAYEIHGILKL